MVVIVEVVEVVVVAVMVEVVVVVVVVVVVEVVVVVMVVVVMEVVVVVVANPTVYLRFCPCLKRNVAEVSQMSQIAT